MEDQRTRVLVVDENEDLGAMLALAIQDHTIVAHHVTTLSAALAAMDHLRPHALIVEDMADGRLQLGMVPALRRKASELATNPRVIVHTCYPDERAEADVCFLKPTPVETLRASLDRGD